MTEADGSLWRYVSESHPGTQILNPCYKPTSAAVASRHGGPLPAMYTVQSLQLWKGLFLRSNPVCRPPSIDVRLMREMLRGTEASSKAALEYSTQSVGGFSV